MPSPSAFPQSPAAPTCTTPPGLTPIIMQMPRKAESFSSLSLMFLRDVHLWERQHQRSASRAGTPWLSGQQGWGGACMFGSQGGRAGTCIYGLAQRRAMGFPPTAQPSTRRLHAGGHTPRPDELLQHRCHLLWAHIAQAADGDGWNGRGTHQATCNPEWPRDGTWRGLWHEAPAPPLWPQGNSSCWLPGPQSLAQQGLL